jgi:dTDP-4-dehydrorhamnose reductase
MYIVLGKTGYIGSAFIEYLTDNNIPHIGLSRREVDYTDESVLSDYLTKNWLNTSHNLWRTMKGGIINCAGYIGKPNVDACEAAKAETLLGNSILPERLARICADKNIPFIHISSGCIYGGYDKMFSENDKPNFDFQTGSFYSGTKALGERLIAKTNQRSYIFRLRIPFDHRASPRNYITKMLSYDNLVDAVNSMSHRGDFVEACLRIAMNRGPFGIYNITNPGAISTKVVVDMISEYIAPDKKFSFYKDMEQFMDDVVAPRSNCVLDTSKLDTVLGAQKMRPLEVALEDSIKKYA